MTNRRFSIAVVFLGAFVVSQAGFAAEDRPDFVDQYVTQVRKTIDTTDMEVIWQSSKTRTARCWSTCAKKTSSRPDMSPARSAFPAGVWSSGFGSLSAILIKWT